MKGSKGAILVQVLIMGALLLVLVMFLVRAVSQNYHLSGYVTGETRETKNAEASIGAVLSVWAANSANGGADNCTPGGAVACAGVQGSCNCTCTVSNLPTVVSVSIGNGNCQLRTDTTTQPGQFSYP